MNNPLSFLNDCGISNVSQLSEENLTQLFNGLSLDQRIELYKYIAPLRSDLIERMDSIMWYYNQL